MEGGTSCAPMRQSRWCKDCLHPKNPANLEPGNDNDSQPLLGDHSGHNNPVWTRKLLPWESTNPPLLTQGRRSRAPETLGGGQPELTGIPRWDKTRNAVLQDLRVSATRLFRETTPSQCRPDVSPESIKFKAVSHRRWPHDSNHDFECLRNKRLPELCPRRRQSPATGDLAPRLLGDPPHGQGLLPEGGEGDLAVAPELRGRKAQRAAVRGDAAEHEGPVGADRLRGVLQRVGALRHGLLERVRLGSWALCTQVDRCNRPCLLLARAWRFAVWLFDVLARCG